MANEVVSVPHERELYISLNKVGSQIKAVMPKSWDEEDFKRLLSCAAIQSRKWGRSDQERHQIISQLDTGSFIEAVTTAASCNIMPDGRRGYLITRQSRNANGGRGGYTVTFQADYKGLIDVAKRADPRIMSIHADTIHANDEFEYAEGSNRGFHHSIPRETLATGRGEVQGAYAIVYYKGGHYDAEVLDLADLKKIMGCASANFGPNKDWPLQMHRKAAIRRLCKRLPETPDLARLMDVENSEYDVSGPTRKPAKVMEIASLPPVKLKEEEEAPEEVYEYESPPVDSSRYEGELIEAEPVEEPKPAAKPKAKKKKAAKKVAEDKDRVRVIDLVNKLYAEAQEKKISLSVNIDEEFLSATSTDDLEALAEKLAVSLEGEGEGGSGELPF